MPKTQFLLDLSLKIGQLLIQNISSEQLVVNCCQKITDSQLFNNAWIGLISNDQTHFITVESSQEHHSADLNNERIAAFIQNHSLQSLGIAGRSILENQYFTLNSLHEDTSYETLSAFYLWQELFNSSEVKSVIVLPLSHVSSTKPIGCLMVTSNKNDCFTAKVSSTLQVISSNISQMIEFKAKLAEKNRAEIVFQQERLFLDNLINSIPFLIFYKDLKGVYIGANTYFEKFCGKTEAEIIGKTDFDLFNSETAEFFQEQDQKILISKTEYSNEEWIKYPDGKKVLLKTTKSPVLDKNNDILGLIGISRDITKYKLAEKILKEKESRFRELLNSMPNIAIQGYDKSRNTIYWNQASELLYGYTAEEALGQKLESLIIPQNMQTTVIELIRQWYEKDIVIPPCELKRRDKSGNMVPVYSSHVMLKNSKGNADMFCIDIDLTEQKNTQVKLEHLANYDQLTHLPNRNLFLERLEQSLSEARRFNKVIAIIFMDLDNFKYINDTFGHEIGDILLIQVADRLKHALRKYDLISRFGGDEFVIALSYLENEKLVVSLVEKLKSAFKHPFELKGQSSYITCSMGVSLYPASGDSSSLLLKNADMAMYKAKDKGRNQFHFFNEDINHKINQQIELSDELKFALERNEFSLLFQPQIDLSSGEIVACEALLRWTNKKLGDISPHDFIPVAEQSYLINEIDFWVLEEIQKHLRDWLDSGKQPVRIFANFSERGFSDNIFLAKLKQFIQHHRSIARYLGIEMSESVLLKTSEQTTQTLSLLHDSGICLALDHFGEGYSSLSYLKNSPVDRVKISREFIDKASIDGYEESYINAIIAMAQALSIKTVAMGVERKQHKLFIEQTQCELAQGGSYYKLMTADELKQLLKLNVE